MSQLLSALNLSPRFGALRPADDEIMGRIRQIRPDVLKGMLERLRRDRNKPQTEQGIPLYAPVDEPPPGYYPPGDDKDILNHEFDYNA
jgi:hypothetical protein